MVLSLIQWGLFHFQTHWQLEEPITLILIQGRSMVDWHPKDWDDLILMQLSLFMSIVPFC